MEQSVRKMFPAGERKCTKAGAGLVRSRKNKEVVKQEQSEHLGKQWEENSETSWAQQ